MGRRNSGWQGVSPNNCACIADACTVANCLRSWSAKVFLASSQRESYIVFDLDFISSESGILVVQSVHADLARSQTQSVWNVFFFCILFGINRSSRHDAEIKTQSWNRRLVFKLRSVQNFSRPSPKNFKRDLHLASGYCVVSSAAWLWHPCWRLAGGKNSNFKLLRTY